MRRRVATTDGSAQMNDEESGVHKVAVIESG